MLTIPKYFKSFVVQEIADFVVQNQTTEMTWDVFDSFLNLVFS